MKSVVNEKYISRRAQIGQYVSLLSLLIIFATLILSFTQLLSTAAMPLALTGAMLIGVLTSFVGGYYAERFGGPHPHHQGVRDALKGLDDRFTLFQYTLPAPHVLLGPGGLTVILVRSQMGQVAYEEGKWTHRQRGKFLRQLAGQEHLGRPEQDVEGQVEKMERFLEKELPEVEVPVRGVVLFIHPDVYVEAEDAPVPVFYSGKLKSWLRGPGMREPLPKETRRRVEEALT